MTERTPEGEGRLSEADEAAPHPLLRIQQLDTKRQQEEHARAVLPQRAELAAAQGEQARQQQEAATLQAGKLEALNRHKRLEQEASVMESRADLDETRLYSGEVRAIRDLQALQDEVTALRSRQGHLEEQAIEALLEAEQLDESVAAVQADLDERAARITVIEAELGAAEAEIDRRLDSVAQQRTEFATALDEPTLGLYERLRATFGPSTAVEFDPTQGCRCPHQMPAAEVARIKRCEPGSVEACMECERIVIR